MSSFVGANVEAANKLTGAIDELYVYTSALDREAISVLYGSVTASPTVTPAPSTYYFEGTLRAYYSFDEGNATDATGAYSGDTYKNEMARNLGPTESRDGGDALGFDGNIHVALPDSLTDSALIGDEERTICLWARIDDWNGGFLFEYGDRGSDGESFGLAVGDAESNVTLALSGSYETVVTIYGNTSYIDWDDWHHYCLTYDGSDVVLYFDGLAEATARRLSTRRPCTGFEWAPTCTILPDALTYEALTGDEERTICLWARIDDWNGGFLFEYGSDSADGASFGLAAGNAEGNVTISLSGAYETVVTIYGNTSYIDWGDWHHYCLTYDGSDVVLYFDGLAEATARVSRHGHHGTLRAYYSFDEGNATDATGAYSGDTYKNGNARNLGPTESRDGGDALGFDGEVYAVLPDALTYEALTGDEERTICLWARIDDWNGGFLFEYGSDSADGASFGLAVGDAESNVTLALSGSYQTVVTIYGNTSYIDWDDWHHYCLTYDGTDVVLYFDGLAEAAAPASLDTATTYGLRVGADMYGSNMLTGAIDELYVDAWDGGFFFSYGAAQGGARDYFALGAAAAEGNITVRVDHNREIQLPTSASDDWDDWHHYCLTYDGADVVLYFDGAAAWSKTIAANTGAAVELTLGSRSDADYFTGALDEVYIYTSALDGEAIYVLYSSVTASPTGNATDATGAYSGETYNENRVARNFGPTESRDGGDALYFDGSIYVQLPDALTSEYLTGNAERTICLWARIDDWNGGFLFEYGSAGWDGASFGLAAGDAEGNLTLALGDAYETVVTILGNTSYIDWDDWHHYCLTYDGTDLVLYFDGLAEATSALTLETGVAEFYVGADLSGYDQLTGAIDELYVYTSALDPGAISVLYGSVTASPTGRDGGDALLFDGTASSAASLPSALTDADSAITGADPRTICLWAQVDAWDGGFFFSYGAAQGGARDYFALGAAASEGNVTVRVDRDREVRLPGRSRRRLANASGYWDDWHHYCLAYDGADVALYFDGAAAWSRTIAANTGAAVELTLGSRSGADYFTGALDEIYVYASALDAAGAAALYAAVTLPTPAPSANFVAVAGTLAVVALPASCDDADFFDGYASAIAAAVSLASAVDVACDGDDDGAPSSRTGGGSSRSPGTARRRAGRRAARRRRPRRRRRRAARRGVPASAPTGSPSQTPSAAPSSVPTSPPTPGPTATFAPTAPAAIDLAYAVATVLSDADDGFDAGGFASFVQASVETAVANGTFAAALAAAGVVGSVSSVGAVAVPETLTEADLASREWREAVVVTLRTTPAADVAVTYASDDLWFYSSLASDEKASRMSTTFRPGDKNATVYASMRRDRVDRGASFVAAVDVAVASDGDANYAPGRFASSHNVTVYDVDTSDLGAWESRETRTDDGLFYAGEAFDLFRDEGGTFTISVRLTSIPKNDVTVALRGAGGFAAVEPAANFTFEPEAWNVPHTVSLTAADDDLLTGDVVHRVYFESSSAAAAYDGLRSGAANLTVLENDVAYCTVSAKKLTVGANGDGATFGDAYFVSLSAAPSADVVVTVSTADAATALSPRTLVFSPDDWDAARELNQSVFLDGGAGIDVLFDSATDRAGLDGSESFDCSLIFDHSDVFGDGASCDWRNSSAVRATFGSGATLVPFDYANATTTNAVYLRAGMVFADVPNATLAAVAQYSEALAPYNPVAPVIGLSAPDTVGVCDGVVLDASGATGGGSRTLIYAWALQILWEPDDEAQAASVTALVAALDAATFDQIVRLSLSWDALLPGKKYTFLVSAANFLGETTTASHTLLKSAAPSPNVQFQGATESMVRSDPKSLRLDVSLPSLNCTDQNVSSNELTYFWSARRRDGGAVSARLPKNALNADADYEFSVTVAFAASPMLNNTATRLVQVGSEDLVASVGGGAEQMVAIGGDVLLDGSASYDPDNATAAGPLAFSWTAADSLGAAASFPASTSASAKALAFVATAADGWGPDTYAITLVVSRGTRTATKTVSLTVSSDAYIPRAAITDFDESVKYNPTPDSYAAIYFTTSSPDPDRTCCDTRWAVVGDAGDASGLISKDPSAASPMLVDLGNTLPNTVYNFRLTATDGIGSSASTVVALAINGAPTSGTFYVAPESGTALTTSFEFAMDSWTDDVDDYPLTYEFGYLDGAAKTFKPLVSDRYSTSWYATTMPKLASDNATCVGRVFDRYDAYAERSYGIMVLELVISTEDLSSFASDSIGESLDTGSGEEALALISSVASVIGAGGAAAANRTAEEQAAEAAAQQSLIEDLMKATLSATSLVSTDTSSAATGQVLDTVAFLVASPDALSENTQTDAIGLLGNVVGGALSSGMDAGAAGSSATALSGVLDASLFKKNDTAASVANDMTAVVASLSAAMIANAFGGQAKSIVSPNLEVSSFRTDCGTRSDAYALSSGAAVAMPDDAMDAAGGGGACAANGGGGRRRLEAAAENVDVRVSQMKNVYESTGAAGDVNSDLVQVELGSDGGTAAINGLSDPIVLVIQFEAYDEMLDTRFDNSKFMRQGTCYDMDDFLTWDDCPGNPATYNCSQPQYVTFKNGANATLYPPPVGHGPLNISVSCPGKLPECTFWDENRSRWSGDNCTVRNYTAYNVTCACTHLTDFAGATKDVGSTASAVVATGANMNLAQLMEALVVLITLLATLGVFVFACVKGRQLDKQDFNNREELRREALPDAFLKKVVASRETEHVALSAAFKAKARRPWIMARSPFAVYTRSIRPVRGWCNTALYSFVMAMRREHKILQIFYLPDGTYTRTERITVLCVLVFGTLACNAIFLSVLSKIQVPGLGTCDANACLGKPQPCVDFKAMVAKGIFSTLSAFGSTLVYILFAYAFGKTGDAISDVDHFLGVDPANLDDEAKGRVKRRKAVLTAVANLDGAKHRQKLVERRLAKDLETMFKYRKGQVGTARQLQAEDRIAFTEIHRVKRTKAQIHVDKMQLALLKAKKKFDVYVKKQADARKEEKRKELFEMKGAWARFKYRRQKDKPMYSLTLDEQALYEAEEVELARMSFLPRTLYRKFVSPIKRAFRKEKKTWPTHVNYLIYALAVAYILGCAAYVFLFSVTLNNCSQCEQDEDNEVCIPPAEEGDDEPAECTCPDTLYDYCGGGNSNAASMAWLEMALASVVIALFISSSLVLFMTKGVVPTIARGCTACGAKPPTEDPDPKRGLAGLVERVDHEAKAKRGIKVRGYGDDSTTARDPWIQHETLDLDNLRVNLGAQVPEPGLDRWPRPGERGLTADGSSTLSGRPATWKCPCGAVVPVPVRRDHLRYDCLPYRDSFEGAARKWLAANDPSDAKALVDSVAREGRCAPGEALCALSVCRKGGVAIRKLANQDYRDEMVLAAEVIDASDLLGRWVKGSPLKRRKPPKLKPVVRRRSSVNAGMLGADAKYEVKAARGDLGASKVPFARKVEESTKRARGVVAPDDAKAPYRVAPA
ncbi:hypothetical protein JL722_7540 [Aureococcus anophagefferens]|nr:hypothetical protein JL722_7540 [Aureococcus anophagefferens]